MEEMASVNMPSLTVTASSFGPAAEAIMGHGERTRAAPEGEARRAERTSAAPARALVPERVRGRQPLPDDGSAPGPAGRDVGLHPLHLRRRLERRAGALRAGACEARLEQPLRSLKPRALVLGREPRRDGRSRGEARRLRVLGL